MDYSVGIYPFNQESMADKVRLDDLINRMATDRWTVRWVGTTYRGTNLIVLFERIRIQ